MLILPAIDLLDGCAVRLKKGAESTKKIYSDNPSEIARQWQASGAQYLHVVNLDGAFGRTGRNGETVAAIVEAVDIPVQLGGGIRSLEDARSWLDVGVARVIFGTVAAESPEIIGRAVNEFGAEKVVVGIDARNNNVAINGWGRETGLTILELAQQMKNLGVVRIVYTDIERDGLLGGPNVRNTAQLARDTGLHVIASGGVSKMEHLEALSRESDSGIEGAIIGTALYENQLSLKTVIEKYQD